MGGLVGVEMCAVGRGEGGVVWGFVVAFMTD